MNLRKPTMWTLLLISVIVVLLTFSGCGDDRPPPPPPPDHYHFVTTVGWAHIWSGDCLMSCTPYSQGTTTGCYDVNCTKPANYSQEAYHEPHTR